MKTKKLLAAAAAAFLIMQAGTADAAPEMSYEQVSEAQIKANHIVPKKKVNFVFASWVDFHGKGNLQDEDDEVRTTGDAYWITPFCHVMNEQITQTRTGNRDFKAIPEAGKEYQLRVLIATLRPDSDIFRDALVTVKQGNRELVPLRVRYTNLQRTEETELVRRIMWHKVGIVLDFAADDVKEKIPVQVTVSGNSGLPMVFPELDNDIEYNSYDTKSHNFQWYPLHDKL